MFDLETIKAINTPGYKWQHTEPIVSKPTMSDSESRVRMALYRLLEAFEADRRISPDRPMRISWETNSGAIRQAREALAAIPEPDSANVYSRHEHRSA